MSEVPPEPTEGEPTGEKSLIGRALPWAILTLIGIGVGAILYVMTEASFKPAEDGLAQYRRASLHRLQVPPLPTAGPSATVADPQGRQVPLVDPEACLTLVNLWATWCAPCRVEMPTLAAAQRTYGARGLRVVAVSLDRPQEQPAARAFIGTQAPLAFYADPTMALFNGLQPRPQGLPVTLLVDAQGRERARVVGDANWTSPEARGLIERLLSERPAAQAPQRPDSAS
jgi:thiol-disulfide isomerase/thioredoxin